VIIINTKRGSRQNSIEVDFNRGINIRLLPLYETISSPERYAELGWESLRNYGMLANGLSREEAGVFASENIFATTRGIAPIYNMWNCAPNAVIDPATGKFSGASRKYTPENWADYMFRNGQRTEANLRFSSGSENMNYFASFGYLFDEGYALNSDFSRINSRINLDFKPTSWLKTTVNAVFSNNTANNTVAVYNSWDMFRFLNFAPPIYPVFRRDADGNKIPDEVLGGYKYDYGDTPGSARPFQSGKNLVAANQLDQDKTTVHNLAGNVNFEISFLRDFKFTSANSYQYSQNARNRLLNPYYGESAGMGKIFRDNTLVESLALTQSLFYGKRIDLHRIDLLAMHETLKYSNHVESGVKYMIAQANNVEYSNAIGISSLEGMLYERSTESYMAQAKYDYNAKYFADVNIRRDGSSRFTNHKWGNFGSMGAAWIVNKETFMDNVKFINYLRLKASYGITGNEALILGNETANYYPTLTFYDVKNLEGAMPYVPSYIGNDDLTWEKSRMFNTGIDFALWNNFLSGEIEFYNKRTYNMLFYKQVPSSWGYTSKPVNDAELENAGIEFTLKAKLLNTKEWKVDLSINGSHYSNKILRMPQGADGEKDLEIHGLTASTASGNGFGWSRGHGIYDYYMREYAGVNSETGQAQWYIHNADGTKTPTSTYSEATMTYIGKSAVPDILGAFKWNVGYKNFKLGVQFLYSAGGYGYDAVYLDIMTNDLTANYHKDIERRWTTAGQITDVPRLSANYDTNAASLSSRFLTSMSYLSLNSIRAEYDFKLSKFQKLGKFKVWLSAENLYAWTARKGYYPFVSEYGESVGTQNYTPMSSITAGIKLKF
jgi:TonB-linked SusC/RagA family outer membrane protein